MLKELKYLFTAICFLTRIPCYYFADFTEEGFSNSIKYFSFVGVLIGLFSAALYLAFLMVLPKSLSLLLSIVIIIIVTGAIHEDGLADTIDSFGAYSDKEKILFTMKDSKIGTYGVIALISSLSIKYFILIEIPTNLLIYVLMLGHSLSRYCAVSVMFNNQYSRINDDTTKTISIVKKLSYIDLILLMIFGLLPLYFLDIKYLLVILPVLLVRDILMKYFNKKIEGYTGDCLGTIQQSTEITNYLFVLLLYSWKFI